MRAAAFPFQHLKESTYAPSKVRAPFAPIPSLRLWVSGLQKYLVIRAAYFESSCPGEQELSFFMVFRSYWPSIGSCRSLFLVPHKVSGYRAGQFSIPKSPNRANRHANRDRPDPGRGGKPPEPIQTTRC